MSDFQEGTQVTWDWGNGTATGKIEKKYTRKITLKIKGNEVTRNASDDEPAFLISQDDGAKALKSVTEIRRSK